MVDCTCVRCGKQFKSKHKTSVCPDCGTTGVCCVCGKEFELKWPYTAKTCSAKCRGILRRESGQGKEIAEKSLQTKKDKYEGSVNVGLMPKKCAYCGKMFIPNSNRQKYCGDDYGQCPVCGQRVKIKDMNIGPQCCSEECRQKRIKQTNLDKYGCENVFQADEIKDKIKDTNLKKYGVERYQSTDEYRSKYQKTMNSRYGVDYPLQNDEIKKKWVDTNLEKYGTEYPYQNEEVKQKAKNTVTANHGGFGFASDDISEKIKNTTIDRYGVEYPLQSEDIKETRRRTNLDKYGLEYSTQSEAVKEKIRNTNQERYGVDSPLGSKDIQAKIAGTVKNKYGVDNVFQNEAVKDKIKTTNIDKYGYANPMQNPEVRQRARATNFEKYGRASWRQSDMGITQSMTDPSRLSKFKEFQSDIRSFINKYFSEAPTLQQIADLTGVTVSTISLYILNQHCEDLIRYRVSTMEQEVKDYILSIDDTLDIIMHDRKQIAPMELDLYLPDYGFAIECNPTYTHNSTYPSFKGDTPVPIKYHQEKSLACKDKGIFLFHIFGYEWSNRRDVVLSMIRNILGKNEFTVYGRNTEVKEVSQSVLDEFLNDNHRQGSTTAKIRLGLFNKDNNELVSVMTFSKLRSSLGKKSTSTDNDIELSRFCSKLNTTVIGAASKLFKYFKDNYEYDKIVSFSDIAHTRGSMYEDLGFEQVSISNPSYVWVNMTSDKYLNRVSCQKRNLQKLFNSDYIDIDNQSESDIMKEHGYVKVYDCGVIRWEYE